MTFEQAMRGTVNPYLIDGERWVAVSHTPTPARVVLIPADTPTREMTAAQFAAVMLRQAA